MVKRLVVLGGGESGIGATVLGKKKGFSVFLSDKGLISLNNKKELEDCGVDYEEGKHTLLKILEADIVVKSPGIPDNVDVVKQLKSKEIPVISEIEFASYYTDAKIIGITGSNGKTTCTMLAHHVLKSSGFDVGVGGNIGFSFARQVAEELYKSYVLELSSFQLDGIEKFCPHIAIITNITPDHLDRYGNDFSKYVDSKFRITRNQTESDYLIYDADDKVIQDWLNKNKVRAKLVPFSLEKELENGAFLKEKEIIFNINKKQFMMEESKLTIKGKHNVKNAMASGVASKLLGARNKQILEGMSSFEGANHRLEKVKSVDGVEYINDSKATNINATYYALECVDKPAIWIVGGVDKGNDYSSLMSLVREKVKTIVCLGLDNEKIISAFENVIDDIYEVEEAGVAVQLSHKLSQTGDTVLLSPACASFDLFENYEDRGNQFKAAVEEL